MKKELKEFRKDFLEWSGFTIEGETGQELKESLRIIHWSLECELSEQRDIFNGRISEMFNDEEL